MAVITLTTTTTNYAGIQTVTNKNFFLKSKQVGKTNYVFIDIYNKLYSIRKTGIISKLEYDRILNNKIIINNIKFENDIYLIPKQVIENILTKYGYRSGLLGKINYTIYKHIFLDTNEQRTFDCYLNHFNDFELIQVIKNKFHDEPKLFNFGIREYINLPVDKICVNDVMFNLKQFFEIFKKNNNIKFIKKKSLQPTYSFDASLRSAYTPEKIKATINVPHDLLDNIFCSSKYDEIEDISYDMIQGSRFLNFLYRPKKVIDKEQFVFEFTSMMDRNPDIDKLMRFFQQ